MDSDPELEQLTTEVHDVFGAAVLRAAVVHAMSVASGAAIEVMGMEAVRPVSDIERVQAAWAATFPDALKLELRRLLTRR
jgi:hypothetical protein